MGAEGIRALCQAAQGETMLDVALVLAKSGWPVLPCAPETKAPLIAGGFHARSSDEERVREWWAVHPDAMPGIVPGDHGLAALDVDSAAAYSATLAAGIDPDAGFVVETGGTSAPFFVGERQVTPRHVYVVVSAGELRVPGVVVRQNVGYVIAPGSVRGNRKYRVLHDGEPQVVSGSTERPSRGRGRGDPAPDFGFAVRALNAIPNTFDRERWVSVAHMVHGALGEAGREPFLAWSRTWRGGQTDEAENARVWETLPPSELGWSALYALARECGFAEPDPLVEQEFSPVAAAPPPQATVGGREALLRRLVQAIRQAPNPTARALAVQQALDCGFSWRVLDIAMTDHPALQVMAPVTLAELRAHPELMALPEPAVPRLAWFGAKSLLAGREKLGKSTLVAHAVSAATRGEPFFGVRAARPIRVLWLTEEPLGIVGTRLLRAGADPERISLLPMSDQPSAQLDRALDAPEVPNVIVIDTLYRFANVADENSASDWATVLAQFDRVTALGAALLLVSHAPKGGGWYRGSTAIGGYMDVLLQFVRPEGTSENVREVRSRGRLSSGDTPLRYRLDEGEFRVVLSSGEAPAEEARAPNENDGAREDPLSLRDWVLTALGLGPATYTELGERLGRPPGVVLRTLQALKRQGLVEGHGSGWRLTRKV